ncbi:PucR family transcriptional regulator [Pseudonocardia acaciae]|uniref:PucR family transcriptional regulator n=1 Tax=Pseudonocardia acaciae TaxID=551276 RepID=UPI00048DACB1|nr:PucR family transcriptional regulator [Pseudonocardia acaciae]
MANGPVRVADCLALPEFGRARLVAGDEHTGRTVGWVAVIEWPVEDFVSAGDLVLSTAIGCDEARMRELVGQSARSGAAAVGLTAGSGAPHPALPESVLAEARAHRIPLLELPWRMRFSDLSRAVIQALYVAERPAAGESEDLPAEFARALLGPGGVAGIAEALEQVVDAPVVVLDATLAVLGSGAEGADWVADESNEAALVEAMLRVARRQREPDPPRVPCACLGGSGEDTELVATPAQVHGGVLGWVVAVVSGGDREAARRAVLHAGTATAIELVRGSAQEEAESRARAEFAWRIATRGIESPHELAARAALLGLPQGAGFRVALGLVEAEGDGRTATELARRLRRRLRHRASVVAVHENEVMLCAHQGDGGWPEPFDGPLGQVDAAAVSWGIARGTHPLTGLAHALDQARAALAVTRALRGTGSSADAERLGSYMLLAPLATDPMVLRLVDAELDPLARADRARNSDLLHTLRVYFEENGNISASARRLYLNRHSLIYRLRKVEQLTGRDLNCHEDRLMLDLSLRVRRLSGVPGRRRTG